MSLRKRAEPVTLVRSPTLTKSDSSSIATGSRPGEPGLHRHGREGARRAARHALLQQPDVLRRRAAAAAEDVDQAGGRVLPQDFRRLLRQLVVLAEGVRQARVGIGADAGVRHPRQLLDVRAQLAAAERAVEAHGERARMADGVPERLGRLAGEDAAGGIGDRARDHDRQLDAGLVEQRQRGVDRRLGVEGVDDRLDEEEVGAAPQERPRRLEIGRRQLIEGGAAVAGIVDVGRERAHAAGRAQRPRHEDRASRRRRVLVGGRPRESRSTVIELGYQRLHAVVRLRYRVGVERVGLDDVRAGIEVRAGGCDPMMSGRVSVRMSLLPFRSRP